MSTGFSEEGTERLICGIPPGGTGEVETTPAGSSARWGFAPNVFAGEAIDTVAGKATIPLGVSNFSLEVWLRTVVNWNEGIAADAFQYLGVMDDANWAVNSGQAVLTVFSGNFNWAVFNHGPYGGAGTGRFGWGIPNGENAWHYYSFNVDRAANGTLYYDTVADGNTFAVGGAVNVGTHEFYPLTYINAGGFGTLTPLDQMGTTQSPTPWLIGPIAMHNRILTAAERAESFINRNVQNISGVTWVKYDWSKIDGLHTTPWDFDVANHSLRPHREIFTGSTEPAIWSPWDVRFGLPQGTTVIVRDVSENLRDYTLPATANSYPSVLADGTDRCQVMFGYDPFFSRGGLNVTLGI